MKKTNHHHLKRVRRHKKIRNRVSGTATTPRLSVFRSNVHIYAQLIDDVSGKTLASASDYAGKQSGTKTERAQEIGKEIAKQAQAQGITACVFDRGGFSYAGRIRACAEGARVGGLQF
jgi:large subunit ribosomal protein L18